MSTLVLAKNTDWCRRALALATEALPEVTAITGEVGQSLPSEASSWAGDFIISFVSPWIVPSSLLKRARAAAINFHPGPPAYPGIGCYNFALFDEVSEYGVTCHHMASRVDTGRIIEVTRFPVTPEDSVASLKERSMEAMFALLTKVVTLLAKGRPLPESEETWARRPFTRAELNELGRITSEMPETEIRRRHRAMHFAGSPGAFVEIAGVTFRA